MARGGYGMSAARSQNRVVAGDSDNEGLQDATSIPDSYPDNDLEDPPTRHRPTRKSKEKAGKAWETLKPGKKRTQTQLETTSDNDTAEVISTARKRPRSGTIKAAIPLTAAQYPAPDVPSDDDEPEATPALTSHRKHRIPLKDADLGSMPGDRFPKNAGSGKQVRKSPGMKNVHVKFQDRGNTSNTTGDHRDRDDSPDEDMDEEYEAEEDYQEDDADEEDEEAEEVEEEDQDQDEASLARQLEAERATWANENTDANSASNDEDFPDVSTIIQATSAEDSRRARAPLAKRQGAAAKPKKRTHPEIVPSDEDAEQSDKSSSVSALRPPKKRIREELYDDSSRSPPLSKCKTHKSTSILTSKPQSTKKGGATVPKSSGKQLSQTPGKNSLKLSRRTDVRTPSKTSTRGAPHSKGKVKEPKRADERQAIHSKPRRLKARQQETVEWLDGDGNDSSTVDSPAGDDRAARKFKSRVGKAREESQDEEDDKKRINRDRSEDAGADVQSESDSTVQDSSIELVDPGPKLALTNQHPRVKAVVLRAIEDVLIDICLKNAFPEGPDKHNQFTRPTLIRIAKDLKSTDIARRLQTDSTYSRYLGSIPAQRISTFRGKIKKHTDGVVESTYGLSPGDGAKVDWLDHKLTYIYPHEYRTRKVERHLPYNLSIFGQVMRAMWFSRPTSHGFKIMSKFTSSSLTYPREKEIPAPMLALVATAIYASIVDYSAPTYKAGDFTGNEFSDMYARNIRALQSIKDADVEKYHVLMHGFFKALCGSHASVLSGSRYADDLDALDIAGMPGA